MPILRRGRNDRVKLLEHQDPPFTMPSFGNPADCESPVALRPALANGLPGREGESRCAPSIGATGPDLEREAPLARQPSAGREASLRSTVICRASPVR